MKIGIVCYPTFGGSGVVATELGIALAEKGHEVHFITYNQPVRLSGFLPNVFYHEVRVKDYPVFDYPPYELVLSSKLVDIVRYYNLDILHVHYAIPHATAAYMAQRILESKGVHIPFITTLHGTDITLLGKDASFEPAITFAINESNAVTTVSESLRKDTFKHFKIDREIEVIPNFINTDQYNEQEIPDRSVYAPNGEKILVHISNFRRVKRVGDVVRVFNKIRKEVPAKLLMVGDGPERQNVEEMCRELGDCQDVIMLGKMKNTGDILRMSDLFILPSESESFGLAALEAMACGLPVISTNTGGIPEVNTHGVTGCTAEVGDVDTMAEHTLMLLTDEKKHAKMSENALKRAAEFDLKIVLPQYEALYEQTLAAAGV